jgi:hypothetical protein
MPTVDPLMNVCVNGVAPVNVPADSCRPVGTVAN